MNAAQAEATRQELSQKAPEGREYATWLGLSREVVLATLSEYEALGDFSPRFTQLIDQLVAVQNVPAHWYWSAKRNAAYRVMDSMAAHYGLGHLAEALATYDAHSNQ